MNEATANPTIIAGDEALAQFRQGLTGARALDMLDTAGGGLLLQLPVGVGKTAWMVEIIVEALSCGAHDLVVVLIPRWDALKELLELIPSDMPKTVLSPRPRKRCGDLDAPWSQYEKQSLGFLGRSQLCAGCPHHGICPWPGQYGSRLRGVRLILATQQHLALNPSFILQLKQQTQAINPLVLIDESNLLIRPAERTIQALELQQFIQAQEDIEKLKDMETKWLELSRIFALAATRDLRDGKWRFPWVDAGWATRVQLRGLEISKAFRFLAYELHHFAHSDPGSRERLSSGDIRFASLPYLGNKFLIFSGSMPKELARYRLDPDHARPALVSPFARHRFTNPGTKFYNINNMAGAARYFPKNAGHILDFFAAKIARNISEGKRTLLVTRKKFVPLCRRLLRERFTQLGIAAKVVTGNWSRQKLNDPRVISLITY